MINHNRAGHDSAKSHEATLTLNRRRPSRHGLGLGRRSCRGTRARAGFLPLIADYVPAMCRDSAAGKRLCL
jgi:hypothetical protein